VALDLSRLNAIIEGLRGNAQRKRQEAFDKVEQGIQKLIKEQKLADESKKPSAKLYKSSRFTQQLINRLN